MVDLSSYKRTLSLEERLKNGMQKEEMDKNPFAHDEATNGEPEMFKSGPLKMVFVGDAGCGKSTFLVVLSSDKFVSAQLRLSSSPLTHSLTYI